MLQHAHVRSYVWTGEHRAVARKAHEPRLVHELLGLTREEVKKTQRHIDAFVLRALELLQIERDAELDATQLSLEGASSAIGAPRTAVPVPTDQDCDERGVEQCDSITNLTPTGSTTGLAPNSISFCAAYMICFIFQACIAAEPRQSNEYRPYSRIGTFAH
jgi:hypothetical protein